MLRNPKVHFRVRNISSLVAILSQVHPVHNFSSYFPKTHSNIIHFLLLRSSQRIRPVPRPV